MGIIEKCNNKFKYACLFITFFIEVFNYSIVNQHFLWINSTIFLWKVLLSLYLLFTVTLKKKEICIILISLLLILITQPLVYNDSFVDLLILVLFCKDLKSSIIIKVSLAALIFGCIVNVAVVEFFDIPYWVVVRDGVALTGLGFTHKNIFPNFLTTIALGVIYLDNACKRSILSIILCLLLSFISFELKSRTPGLLLILVAIMHLFKFLALKNDRIHKVYWSVVKLTPLWVALIVLFAFSCTVLNNYEIPIISSVIDTVNGVLSGRINLQTKALNNLGIPLIGIGQITSGYTLRDVLVLDSGFFLGLYKRGLLFIVCFVTFYVIKANKQFKKGNDVFNLIVLFKAIEGISEVFFMDFLFTPFLLLTFIEGDNDD